MMLRDAAHDLFGLPRTRVARQTLMRRLKRKESALGVQLLFKLNDSRNSPWYVTEASLRDNMPELFSTRDTTVLALRDALDDIREDLALCKMRDNALASKIRELGSAVKDLQTA